MCHDQKSRFIGDGHPTFNRNPYNWYIKPYYWVDEFIPYYMEISWELIDPIAHIHTSKSRVFTWQHRAVATSNRTRKAPWSRGLRFRVEALCLESDRAGMVKNKRHPGGLWIS